MNLIKNNWTFLTMLVVVSIQWGTLMTRVEFMIDKQEKMEIQHGDLTTQMNSFSIKQAEHEIRVSILEKEAVPLLNYIR